MFIDQNRKTCLLRQERNLRSVHGPYSAPLERAVATRTTINILPL